MKVSSGVRNALTKMSRVEAEEPACLCEEVS